MYVLDTNSVIYYFKGLGRVAERLLSTPPSEVALPAVVLHELEVGVGRTKNAPRRRRQLDAFVRTVRVLPFAAEDARVSAAIRIDLEKQGRRIGPLDTLIAGIALRRGATLVTRNVGEFGRVFGLVVEDWYGDPAG